MNLFKRWAKESGIAAVRWLQIKGLNRWDGLEITKIDEIIKAHAIHAAHCYHIWDRG